MAKKIISEQSVDVVNLSRDSISESRDVVAVEEPLEIRIGEHGDIPVPISITMRTPGSDRELALGFLFSEGLLRSLDDVASSHAPPTDCPVNSSNQITVTFHRGKLPDTSRLKKHFYTTSSCGVCGKASIAALKSISPPTISTLDTPIPSDVLHALPDILRKHQQVFERTGGLHAAAIFSKEGRFVMMREDVGRHNALDKLIGAILLSGEMNASECILLLSGRTSFELIQKALMAGLPVVCSIGAPSSLAISLASENNMTLVGFLSSDRYNVYAGAKNLEVCQYSPVRSI